MQSPESLPFEVREIENTWIDLPCGFRLAARIWLPDGAETSPVPALLEYLPYRKRDLTALRDERMHPYVAGHGYACVRVDIRGSGESDGVLTDEYAKEELDDGVEILKWIANQPWCNGRLGMIGISWGGFNALQIAARRPPGLQAIITACSTDDRYADDVHYMGGCLLGDNLSWAAAMFAFNTCPPDPALVGEAWRKMWLDRMEATGPWLDRWLTHQRRDDYWRHGSVCENFEDIQCPVFAVSGWADGYFNAVFRLLSGLHVPRKGLIGPWGHRYPHLGYPGPAIGFLQEAVRWWDHFLKDRDTGIMKEPMLRVWMQESVPPTTDYETRPGHWVAEPSWPSANVREELFLLKRARLAREGEPIRPGSRQTIESPLSVGLFAGKWCSFSATSDLPSDQREEDGGAIVYTSRRLAEDVEILGRPTVELELSSDKPQAMVAVRISDVAPDDRATRITYGLLNLTHRDGHADPEPLIPGKRYKVEVQLNGIAQIVPKGHRLRLAISTSYWPLAWPAPQSAQLTIYHGKSHLRLPLRSEHALDQNLRAFDEPVASQPSPRVIKQPKNYRWHVVRDLAKDQSTLEVIKDEGTVHHRQIDLTVSRKTTERYCYRTGQYGSVRGEVISERAFSRGDWSVRTRTRTVLTSDEEHFKFWAELDAYEDDHRVLSRNWHQRVKRDHL